MCILLQVLLALFIYKINGNKSGQNLGKGQDLASV